MTRTPGFSWEYLTNSSSLLEVLGVFGAVAVLLEPLLRTTNVDPLIATISITSCFLIFLIIGYIFIKNTSIEILLRINSLEDVYTTCKEMSIILILFILLFGSISVIILDRYSPDVIKIIDSVIILFLIILIITLMCLCIKIWRDKRLSENFKMSFTLVSIPIFIILYIFVNLSLTEVSYVVNASAYAINTSATLQPEIEQKARGTLALFFILLFGLDFLYMTDKDWQLLKDKINLIINFQVK